MSDLPKKPKEKGPDIAGKFFSPWRYYHRYISYWSYTTDQARSSLQVLVSNVRRTHPPSIQLGGCSFECLSAAANAGAYFVQINGAREGRVLMIDAPSRAD